MRSLSSLLWLQFFVGFIGALVSTPILYVIELSRGFVGYFGYFSLADVVMIIFFSLLFGGVFLLAGLVAYPVLKFLQRRGIMKDIL